ncbi:hypothetical protein Ancab_027730, partial [Ancistrocladus abbreviatus]
SNNEIHLQLNLEPYQCSDCILKSSMSNDVVPLAFHNEAEKLFPNFFYALAAEVRLKEVIKEHLFGSAVRGRWLDSVSPGTLTGRLLPFSVPFEWKF